MHRLRNTPEDDHAATPANTPPGLKPFDPVSDLRFEVERRFSNCDEAMMTDPRSAIETAIQRFSRLLGMATPVAVVGVFLAIAGGVS